MKLISMHVENYGKIKNFDLDFNNSITEIFKENGYGKTTIASFIKAMFYGLPKVRQNTINFDDRQRFYPYDDSKFGGSLLFEKNGENYLIERYFDKKSDTKDLLKVYKNNVLTDLNTADLGNEFFDLDEQSFVRTLFFNSQFGEISSSSKISAKLNNFAYGTNDDGDFDLAIIKLEKKQKEIKKSKNGESYISKTQEEIKRLTEEIANLKTKQDDLQIKYAKRNSLKEKIDALSKIERQIKTQELILEKWKRYEDYILKIESEKKCKEQILAKYDNKAISVEDFTVIENLSKEIENNQIALSNLSFSEEKSLKIQEFGKLFKGKNLTQEKLLKVKEEVDDLKRLKLEQDALNLVKDDEYLKLKDKFKNSILTDGELDELKQKVEAYSKNATLIENYATTISSGASNKGSKLILSVIGIIASLLGVGGIFFNLILGGALILAGLFCFILPILLNSKGDNGGALALQLGKLKGENETLERQIRVVLAPYNYYSNYGLLIDYNNFIKDYYAFLDRENKNLQNLKIIGEKSAKIQALSTSLTEFFSLFNMQGDYEDNANKLMQDYKDYGYYSKEKEEFVNKSELYKEQIKTAKNKLYGLLEKYSIKSQDSANLVKEIQKDVINLRQTDINIENLTNEANNYKEQNVLTEKPQIIQADLTELKDLERELALLDSDISLAEMDVENLPIKESLLESENEKLKVYKFQYEMLSKTIDKLKDAEGVLKEKYVAPIKDKFIKYASVIESVLGEKMVMDKDYSIKFIRNGEIRSYKHLSAGQLAICSLCLRLSLIDNMFVDEKPFIIMDDPFINLDKVHFENVKKVVKELSKNIQIIYLTCHESRQML